MVSFCTDEHVPSVFITTLRSNGHPVVRARDVVGEATEDSQLLEYCTTENYLLITHDKKDFAGDIGSQIDHPGIIIYTDPLPLRDEPSRVVRTLEAILEQYPPAELESERVWLDQRYNVI